MEPIRFELTEIRADDLAPNVLALVGAQPGRLLHFKNAVLARSEVNKNRDDVDSQGIQDLAATLPLTAIDKEHLKQVVIGYYTDARAVQEGENTVLSCDGIIFADRYPEEARGVQDGTYFQSIEADAKSAECSVCHKVFGSARDYCEHIQTKTGNRILRGLTAKGGAVTRIPAGTRTEFDLSHLTLIASLAEPELSEGAQRAAHRFIATVDSMRANPGAHCQFSAPVLAPTLWDPNEEFIRKAVARILQESTVRVEAEAKPEANPIEAATSALLGQLELLKNELNARIDALVKENEGLKAQLAPQEKSETEQVVGVIGFSWLGSIEGGAQDKGKNKISWS